MAKSRKDPNTLDPLSEGSWHGRLWAARIKSGRTRRDMARELELSYGAYDAWEMGTAVPKLLQFAKACEILGYTIDEMMYGHRATDGKRVPIDKPRIEPDLADSSIKLLFEEHQITPAQRAAFGEFAKSPAGFYQRFTKTFVLQFVNTYATEVDSKTSHSRALEIAMQKAVQASALAETTAVGGVSVLKRARVDLTAVPSKAANRNDNKARRPSKRKRG